MNYHFVWFLRFSLVFPGLTALAQRDSSVYVLPTIDIRSLRVDAEQYSQQKTIWDSTALKMYSVGNIGDLLARESGAFIKSYGLGSSATSSIRGGSAGHTQVMWNGFPVGNPMLGQADLSLIALGLLDQVQLNYGGNAALWGSGAIGGVIALQNKPDFRPKTQIDYQGVKGSFDYIQNQIRGSWSRNCLSVAVNAVQQSAVNDFPYRLKPGQALKHQVHAAVSQKGAAQQLYWKPAPRHLLAYHGWQQVAHRQIPPTTVQNRSSAGQEDQFFRNALHWQYTGDHVVIQSRAAWFVESVNYGDTLYKIFTNNRFKTWIAESEVKVPVGNNHTLQAGIHGEFNRARSEYYLKEEGQGQQAIFISWIGGMKKIRYMASGRLSWVDAKIAPMVPSFSLHYAHSKSFSAYVKTLRNYRLPSLNDRFWSPGGNPELLPEQGWSHEIGYGYNRGFLDYQSAYYDRTIKDWILWSIAPNAVFWSANNITRVHSRGIEQRVKLKFKLGGSHLALRLNYDWTKSTNEIALQKPKIHAGQQFFYTPKHQAGTGLEWNYRSLQLNYLHRYTDSVLTLGEPLSSYHLGFLHLQYAHQWRKWTSIVFFKIENAWNEQYRAVERIVMPGRSFLGGISISWKQE